MPVRAAYGPFDELYKHGRALVYLAVRFEALALTHLFHLQRMGEESVISQDEMNNLIVIQLRGAISIFFN